MTRYGRSHSGMLAPQHHDRQHDHREEDPVGELRHRDEVLVAARQRQQPRPDRERPDRRWTVSRSVGVDRRELPEEAGRRAPSRRTPAGLPECWRRWRRTSSRGSSNVMNVAPVRPDHRGHRVGGDPLRCGDARLAQDVDVCQVGADVDDDDDEHAENDAAGHVAPRIPDLAGHEADELPPVVGEQRGDHRQADARQQARR